MTSSVASHKRDSAAFTVGSVSPMLSVTPSHFLTPSSALSAYPCSPPLPIPRDCDVPRPSPSPSTVSWAVRGPQVGQVQPSWNRMEIGDPSSRPNLISASTLDLEQVTATRWALVFYPQHEQRIFKSPSYSKMFHVCVLTYSFQWFLSDNWGSPVTLLLKRQ